MSLSRAPRSATLGDAPCARVHSTEESSSPAGYLYPRPPPPPSHHSPGTTLSPPLSASSLHERHAELAEVPGRLGGPERLRLAHHRGRGHPAGRRPQPHHRHRHRRDLGHRRRDGPRAGPARRQARAPRAQPQGRRGDPRPHPRRRRLRRWPRRGAPARPLLPRLRPPLRRPLPRPPPPAQPPHKQRGAVRGAVRGVGGRRGDDLRHQLPGPLPAHQAAPARHGGHGQGHRRAGPRRQRHLRRPRLVRRRRRRRRAPRLPPARHPQGHAVRSDAGLRAVQARQRAPHHGPRRPAQGDGRRRHRQLRPPRHRPDPPHPRPRRPRHKHGVLPGVQAPQDGAPGGGDDVLRGGAPGGGGGVGEVLRRLQRGGAVEAGVQRRGGLPAVELLRGHHRRQGEGGELSSRHQLQVSGPELQRRPRHGHRLARDPSTVNFDRSPAGDEQTAPRRRRCRQDLTEIWTLDVSFRNCHSRISSSSIYTYMNTIHILCTMRVYITVSQ